MSLTLRLLCVALVYAGGGEDSGSAAWQVGPPRGRRGEKTKTADIISSSGKEWSQRVLQISGHGAGASSEPEGRCRHAHPGGAPRQADAAAKEAAPVEQPVVEIVEPEVDLRTLDIDKNSIAVLPFANRSADAEDGAPAATAADSASWDDQSEETYQEYWDSSGQTCWYTEDGAN